MKKIPILFGAAILLPAGRIQAEFTPLVNGDYQMVITSGCFGFGSCASGGFGEFIDNESQANGVVTPTYGINDGDTIQIHGNRQIVDLPTSALYMSATAVDASGNTGNGQTIMFIAD